VDGTYAGDGWTLRIAGERFELQRDGQSYSGEVELVDKMIALQGSAYEDTAEYQSSSPGTWPFVLKPHGDGIHFELYSGYYLGGLGSIPFKIRGERVALLTRK
jgi:hypothetical protein